MGIQEPQLAGDVGYDMRCRKTQVIPSKCFWQVEVGVEGSALRVAIPKRYWGFIMGRSGMLREGLIVSSTPIDSGYRGPLYVFVYNTNDRDVVLGEDERIAQLVLVKSFTPPLQITGTLPSSERGERGFGSTGK
jgi:dUTP pyrophosphatase